MLIREVPGSIPGASYLGEVSVVVLHHQANAGVDPTCPQLGVVAHPCKLSDLVVRYRRWFEVEALAAHDPIQSDLNLVHPFPTLSQPLST